jgi:O-antigen ligase
MVAVVLGYTAARISESPGSTSYAMLLFAALVLTILAFIFGLKRVLLTAAILGIPFQFDKNFHYNDSLSAHGAIGGISVSITTLALVGLYALWGAELLVAPDHSARPQLRWALPALVYIGVAAFSITVATSLSLSVNEITLLAQCVLLFIYVSSTVGTVEQLRGIIFILLLGLTLQASLLVLQTYTGVSIQFAGLSSRERIEETTRVAGTLGSPNSAGGYLAACIAISIALLLARGVQFSRSLAVAGVGVGAFALVLTFSRGAWLSLTIALTLLLGFLLLRGKLTRRIIILGLVVAVLGFLMGDQIQARLHSQAGGLKARESVGEVAVNVIRDYPLTGVGVNNYVTLLSRYTPSTQWAFVPHNKFLLVWSETGLFGLMAFVGFLGAVLRRSWIALHGADDQLLPYAAALSAAFIALLVHMNFEPFHGRLDLMFLFLLAALLHTCAHIAAREQRLRESDLSGHKAGERRQALTSSAEALIPLSTRNRSRRS